MQCFYSNLLNTLKNNQYCSFDSKKVMPVSEQFNRKLQQLHSWRNVRTSRLETELNKEISKNYAA